MLEIRRDIDKVRAFKNAAMLYCVQPDPIRPGRFFVWAHHSFDPAELRQFAAELVAMAERLESGKGEATR